MNLHGGGNRGDRVLGRQLDLPLHKRAFGTGWRLAAGMTGRHIRLSAVLSHVLAALALSLRLQQPG
jgi:hypothetical protein